MASWVSLRKQLGMHFVKRDCHHLHYLQHRVLTASTPNTVCTANTDTWSVLGHAQACPNNNVFKFQNSKQHNLAEMTNLILCCYLAIGQHYSMWSRYFAHCLQAAQISLSVCACTIHPVLCKFTITFIFPRITLPCRTYLLINSFPLYMHPFNFITRR